METSRPYKAIPSPSATKISALPKALGSSEVAPIAAGAAAATVLTNKYAEGYPGKRYYGGCQCVDVVEDIARKRACQLFGADHANVQPHCGANANYAVYAALCEHGDTVLGMDLANGGHLTHGSPVNFSEKNYNIVAYGVNDQGYIDYDQVRDLAKKHRPRMLLAGASAYPRTIDFKTFADIAHEVGAYLFVDMAHIAGLVAVGLHPSPVPYADVVTTTTHKTLRCPRGGMIHGKEALDKKIDHAIVPGSPGHRRQGRGPGGGDEAGVQSLPGADSQKRRRPGEGPHGRGLRSGQRRHRQPPDAGGSPPCPPHR